MGPLARFLALGSLLFAARIGGGSVGPVAPAPAGTALSNEALLFRTALARGLHERDPLVHRRLARNLRFALDSETKDEATLVREALDLGMHETDPVVRRRLVQRMTFELREAGARREPTEAELRAFHAAQPARWRVPSRVRLTQVPQVPLPVPRDLPPLSEDELASRFGPAFARAAFALPVGVAAAGIESAYGLHRVVVRERQPGRRAAFEAVRTQVREAFLAERGAERLRAEIIGLRRRWRLPEPAREPA